MPSRTFNNQLKGIKKSFAIYWDAYGGVSSLLKSPYLYAALFVAVLASPILDASRDQAWFDIALSALPDLLGFTLGGYAILLAFGDQSFQHLIAGKSSSSATSPFMGINAAFVHFIVVQVITIIAALLGNAWSAKSGLIGFIGLWLFSYSIMTAVAAAMSVLRLADWFDTWKTKQREKNNRD